MKTAAPKIATSKPAAPVVEPDEGDDRGQRAVQSVEVGGRLLLALARHAAPMTLKDLAAAAGLTPSRAHPYLVSYGRLRLVDQDPASGRYALGAAALHLGLAALHQFDPLRAAQPVAEALARETGQSVALAVWGNLGPTVVRLHEAVQPLHVAMRVGTVMSVLGTATGRAFAALLPTATVQEVLGYGVGPLAEGRVAVPDWAEAQAELAQARRDLQAHGVTRAKGRPIPGVNAFSAPALDHDGQPVLVITALGHQDHVPADWASPIARAVRAAAHEISQRLGAPGA